VEQHTIKPRWNVKQKVMTQERIDWKAIGQVLGRVPQDCKDKWSCILASKMKKGPLSTEENALIIQRVMEWGDKGNGLWASLQEEMGRPADHIIKRWRKALCKKELQTVHYVHPDLSSGVTTSTGSTRMIWNDDVVFNFQFITQSLSNLIVLLSGLTNISLFRMSA